MESEDRDSMKKALKMTATKHRATLDQQVGVVGRLHMAVAVQHYRR